MLKKAISKDREESKFPDLLGVDFSSTATKVVRLKQSKGGVSLAAMELLPAVDFSKDPARLQLPRNLTTNYGCLSYTGSRAVVRMINTHIAEEEDALKEQKIRSHLNVTDEYRASAQLIKRGKGRQDSSFLAAAIPNSDVQHMLELFPVGPPAPASVEISGLSFMTAFLHAKKDACKGETVCLLETGETVSHFSFLTNGAVSLVGKLPFGAKMLRKQVAEDLGLDEELAVSILSDAAINISSSITSAVAPHIKQLSISKDFIERHQGNRISKIYVSGGLSLLASWGSEVGRLLGTKVESWNPLENIEHDTAAFDGAVIEQATRFSAAIGAAIGGMEA